MSVKNCEKLEKSRVALTIEIDAEAFETYCNKAYLKQRSKLNIPGFRVGKAPRKIIESMYGAEVFYEEAINIALPEVYEAAIDEQKLNPVAMPDVELESVGKEGAVIKCTVDVYPEVTLGEYKGIEAPKAEVKVMAADVNARLKEMAEQNSRMVSVDRAVKKGDIADIDYEGFKAGVAFDGGKAENYDLEIGSGSFIPGFEDKIIGMTAGEEKDIDLTFPEDYHAEDLAGQAVVFHVKVNEVKFKEVPAVDDEFAKDVSEFETLKELKADLKKKITEERTQNAQRAFEDAVITKLGEMLEAEIPDSMVAQQAEQQVNQMIQNMQYQGISMEMYTKITGMTKEQMVEEAKPSALTQIKEMLAIEEVKKRENVEATDEDIEAEYNRFADMYKMNVEDVKKYLPANEIKEQVVTNKTVKMIADAAIATKPEVAEAAEETTEE